MTLSPKALALFGQTDPNLLKRFKKFHTENPQVFEAFASKASDIAKTGRAKYSAWTIIQVIRWESDLKTKGGVFKINNDFIALYARLLVFKDPSFDGFFAMRSMKKERRQISQEEKDRKAAL